MKKLIFVTVAFSLSVLTGVLITSPASVGTAASIFTLSESRLLPSGNYVNVDAGFGSAELTFMDDGRYTYGDDGSVSAEGTYTITGNQIRFSEYGPADAPCLHLSGQYTWRLSGKVLTLTEVKDQCSTRQYDWKSGQWMKERQ